MRRASRSASTIAGSTSSSRSRATASAYVVVRRLLGREDHERGAVPQRELGQAGDRVDDERRADREEQVGVRGRELRPVQVGRARGSRRTRSSPTSTCRRTARHAGSSSPARTRSTRLLHRPVPAARRGTSPRARCRGSRRSSPASCRRAWCRPSTFCVTSVSSAARRSSSASATVPGVRFALPRHMSPVDASAPGALAVLGVRHVVLDRRAPLGGGVLGPDALRPAEVGDARPGGDAGAGEHDDPLRVAQQVRDRRDVGHRARRSGLFEELGAHRVRLHAGRRHRRLAAPGS